MIRTKSSVRSKVIKARISEDEYQKIRAKRQASGLSESEFVRRVLLGIELSGSAAKNQKAMAHVCEIQTILNQARLRVDDAVLGEIQEEVSSLCRYLS